MSRRFSFLLLLLVVAGFGDVSLARAEFVTHWSLGDHNTNPLEFGDETWGTNPPPGSATVRDNDFYFAGIYPSPIGVVSASEPWANLERALSSGNAVNRFHFNLSAGQATPTLRLRFVLHLIWGGWWNAAQNVTGEGYGSHTLEVRLNGTVLKTQTFTSNNTLVVEADAGSFTPVGGENHIA